jgi:integrase
VLAAISSTRFCSRWHAGLICANPIALTNTAVEVDLQPAQAGNLARALGRQHQQLDDGAVVIALPGRRTKNGRPHEIRMAATVRKLLDAQPQIQGRDFVFGKGAGPFSGFSRCKDELDNRIAELNGGKALAPWVLHDLRRSAATGMADIGIAPHVIEAVLNHVSGYRSGVAGIYNRATYAAEKAQALARWDEHIASIVHEYRNTVTPLRGRV